MKYIRTKDGIFEFVDFKKTRGIRCLNHYGYTSKSGVNILGTLKDFKKDKQADTIEELCDEFVYIKGNRKTIHKPYAVSPKDDYEYEDKIYCAIWTDKGLIYVAKMNDKGELELL